MSFLSFLSIVILCHFLSFLSLVIFHFFSFLSFAIFVIFVIFGEGMGGERREGKGRVREGELKCYIHTYRQTYRASDEVDCRGAFAPNNSTTRSNESLKVFNLFTHTYPRSYQFVALKCSMGGILTSIKI